MLNEACGKAAPSNILQSISGTEPESVSTPSNDNKGNDTVVDVCKTRLIENFNKVLQN